MGRVGRPRKPGKRTKSGRLVQGDRRDGPTPEHQAKRMAIVGSEGDTNLSSCPLDALLARQFISQDEHVDAYEYRRWYDTVTEKAVGGESHGEISEERLMKAMARLREAAKVLLSVSRQAKDAVDNCVIYDRWPHVLVSDRPRSSDEHLFAGLRALSQWCRRGERRAA